MKRRSYILYKDSELILRGKDRELELKVSSISLGNGSDGNSSKTVYLRLLNNGEKELPPLILGNGFREIGVPGFSAKVARQFSHYKNRVVVHIKSERGYSTDSKWRKPVPEPPTTIKIREPINEESFQDRPINSDEEKSWYDLLH